MARKYGPSTEKFGEALRAMKSLGISEEAIKPVLERLLELYDHNWEIIEENGYSKLADAIFELGNAKKNDANCSDLNDNLNSQIKKHEVGQESNSTILDLEEDEFLQDSSRDSESSIEEPSGNSSKACVGRGDKESGKNKRIKSSPSSDLISLAVAQKQPIINQKGEVSCIIQDISKGTEKVSISLVDETGKAELPNFVYIRENIVYKSAYVRVVLARISDEDCCENCRGDCLSSVPCQCARETRGEYAYTSEGLLKEDFLDACISMYEEPEKHPHFYCKKCPLERTKRSSRRRKCKGHLVGKFVKECWQKCGCSMICGNRVVQRGITRKLQVFMAADGKGWGFRTLEELPKGAFVCEYVGEVLTNNELNERNKKRDNKTRHTYPVLLDADWASERVLNDDTALCLDATHYGNIGRFVNHRCFDANLIEIPVEVEIPDHHYYHLAFFTKRKVEAFEELTWDYGIDFDDHSHPIEAFKCCCGSAYCRDVNRKEKMSSKNTKFVNRNTEVKPVKGVMTKKSQGFRKSSRLREKIVCDNEAEDAAANEAVHVEMEEPKQKMVRECVTKSTRKLPRLREKIVCDNEAEDADNELVHVKTRSLNRTRSQSQLLNSGGDRPG